MEPEKNITLRKRKTHSTLSLNDVSNTDTNLFDATMTSLPSTSLNDSETIYDLREKIDSLSRELDIAHREIENLNLENYRLKCDLNKSLQTSQAYKNLALSDSRCMTPLSSRANKRKGRCSTPTQSHTLSKLDTGNNDRDITDGGPPSKQGSENQVLESCLNSTEQQTLDDSAQPFETDDVKLLSGDTSVSNSSHIPNSQSKLNLNKNLNQRNNLTPEKKNTTRPRVHDDTKKRKLCVLSNSTHRGILQAIEEFFSYDFKYCSYLMPNSKIRHLLTNINTKLEEFTINDYCIILLGDSDIKTDNNYIDLVKEINESLRQMTHTNIIICTPTYVRGSPIYNYKIDTFNNLLYMDLEYHKYAYFFDSNNALEFKFDMFSDRTGKLNKSGINFIFKNIMERIKIDLRLFPYVDINENKRNSQFFLL